MEHEFTAIILASGASTRFKFGNKLTFKFGDKSVIEHTMDKIKSCGRFKEIIVVSCYDEILQLGKNKGFIPIKNINDNEGIASSIKLGVLNSHNNYMFFVGDQPFIDEDLINKLLDEFDDENIIVPTFNNEYKNPVIFPYEFRDELLNLKGDIGGKAIINNNEDRVKKVEIQVEKSFKDIDTIEDYYKMEKIILVRGAGDVATGIIQKLWRAGFKILVLDKKLPSSIRRSVSLGQCMYDGEASVEDMVSKRIHDVEEAYEAWNEMKIPVLDDEKGESIAKIKPMVLVDAILAKKNLGTNRDMAPITIGVGPGFSAPEDVDVVVETNRGHDLGRLIFNGEAEKNTGIPGVIAGVSKDRVIYSNSEGVFKPLKKIGDLVKKDEIIGEILEKNQTKSSVKSKIEGVLRGVIQEGYAVKEDFKIADVDPRISEVKNCFTISDKARSIGGAVLEAVLYLERRNLREK